MGGPFYRVYELPLGTQQGIVVTEPWHSVPLPRLFPRLTPFHHLSLDLDPSDKRSHPDDSSVQNSKFSHQRPGEGVTRSITAAASWCLQPAVEGDTKGPLSRLRGEMCSSRALAGEWQTMVAPRAWPRCPILGDLSQPRADSLSAVPLLSPEQLL